MCAQSCPPPVVCPQTGPRSASNTDDEAFPTRVVLGGTLGGLSLVVVLLLLYAVLRYWDRTHRRPHSSHRHHGHGHRKSNMIHIFQDPLFTYDVTGVPKYIHPHIPQDVYIARPCVPARRVVGERQSLAAVLDSRDADSSDREFCPRGGDDSRYEPSIIAGSFVYHPPSNLPPHLTRGTHPQYDTHHDLSYDSFKNDHLYDSGSRGVASSTLNNHHQPPDFYL